MPLKSVVRRIVGYRFRTEPKFKEGDTILFYLTTIVGDERTEQGYLKDEPNIRCEFRGGALYITPTDPKVQLYVSYSEKDSDRSIMIGCEEDETT